MVGAVWKALTLSKGEKEAISTIGTLLGGFTGSVVLGKLDLPNLLRQLQGAEEPTPMLTELAQLVGKARRNPVFFSGMVSFLLQQAEERGVPSETVKSLLEKAGSIIGMELDAEGKTPTDVVGDFLLTLSENVLSFDDGIPKRVGVLTACPKCKFVHYL